MNTYSDNNKLLNINDICNNNNCTSNDDTEDTTLEIINMLNNVFDLSIHSRLSTPSPLSLNNIQPFNEEDELNFIFHNLCSKNQHILNNEDNLKIVKIENYTEDEKEFYEDFIFNNLCEKYKELLEEDCDLINIINKNNLNSKELEVYENLIENE